MLTILRLIARQRQATASRSGSSRDNTQQGTGGRKGKRLKLLRTAVQETISMKFLGQLAPAVGLGASAAGEPMTGPPTAGVGITI